MPSAVIAPRGGPPVYHDSARARLARRIHSTLLGFASHTHIEGSIKPCRGTSSGSRLTKARRSAVEALVGLTCDLQQIT